MFFQLKSFYEEIRKERQHAQEYGESIDGIEHREHFKVFSGRWNHPIRLFKLESGIDSILYFPMGISFGCDLAYI
jgi:hypothetical protein